MDKSDKARGRAEGCGCCGGAGRKPASGESVPDESVPGESVPDEAVAGEPAQSKAGQERRDFLNSALGIMGAFGLGAVAWPFIKQLRPDKAAQAGSTIEVDIAAVKPGEQMLVDWQGKPVVIRNRTEQEVAAAKAADLTALEDDLARNANLPSSAKADDLARSGGAGRENWLIFINICTHLSCPTKAVEAANRNMAIPPYRFLSDTKIEIG